jgi:hypothetical protein
MTTLVKRALVGMGMAGSLAVGWAMSRTSMIGEALERTSMIGEALERTGKSAVEQPAMPSRDENAQVLAAIAALRQDMDRLGGKVAGLGVDVARIERQGREEGTSVAANARAKEEGSRDEIAREPATADGASREAERVLDAVESNFRAEKLDTAWASQVSGTIVKAFAQEEGSEAEAGAGSAEETLLGSSLDKVECRSTSCRLEVSHSGPEAFAAFVHGLPSKVGSELPLVTFRPVSSPDGGIATVVFLSRKH